MKVFGRFAVLLLLASSAGVLAAPSKHSKKPRRNRHSARQSHTYHARAKAHSHVDYSAPLLPAREWEGVSLASASNRSTVPMASEDLYNSEPRSTASRTSTSGDSFRLGASLGVLAHEGALPYDSLNSQLYYGGRLTAMAPLTDSIFIRPSLGYFIRSNSSTYGTSTQNIVEGNVNLQYALIPDLGFRLLAGVMQSVQMGFGRLSGSTVSNTTSMVFSYHVGPSLGLLFDITPGFSLTIDSDATWDFSSPFAPFIGLTGGVLFRL